MNAIARWLGAVAHSGGRSHGPTDDYWYNPVDGGPFYVSAETALNCATVLAALRFRGESVAMCPSNVIKRERDNMDRPIREVDDAHYLHRVLRHPNQWQSAWRWRALQPIRTGLWGNSYNRIVGGMTSIVEELRPLHPERVKVLDQLASGDLVYEYRPKMGRAEVIRQADMLHFRGFSVDGIEGVAMYRLIRNAVGIALSAEQHLMTFMKKGMRISGFLVSPQPLGKEQKQLFDESLNEFAGAGGSGRYALLPNGMDFKSVSATNRESQLVELTDQQVGTILRHLGVPGVVIGWQGDKAATFNSAEAFFEKGGIKHTVLPLLTNMESEIEHALLVDEDRQVKFNLDALTRANFKDRIDAIVKATGRPIWTGNEARAIEDMNPSDQEDMNRVMGPPNASEEGSQGPGDDEGEGPPPAPAPPGDDGDDGDEERAISLEGRLREVLEGNASRVVWREMAWLRGTGRKSAQVEAKASSFSAAVSKYYERHVAFVAETMHLSEDEARSYAEHQRDELLEHGIAASENWETEVVPRLAATALGG